MDKIQATGWSRERGQGIPDTKPKKERDRGRFESDLAGRSTGWDRVKTFESDVI